MRGAAATRAGCTRSWAGTKIHAKAFTKTNDWTRYEWRQFRFLLEFVHSGEPFLDRVRAIGSMVRHSSENAAELFSLRCLQGAHMVKSLGLGEGVAQAIYNLDEHWDGKGYPSRLRGDKIPRLAQIVSLAQTLDVFYQQFGSVAALDCMRRRSGRWFDPGHHPGGAGADPARRVVGRAESSGAAAARGRPGNRRAAR